MKMKKEVKFVTFRTTPDFVKRLERIAKRLGVNKSDLIRLVLYDFIRRKEKELGEEL